MFDSTTRRTLTSGLAVAALVGIPALFAAPAQSLALPAAARSVSTDLATPAATAVPTKVLTFIEENHSLAQMQSGMPYLNSLAAKYSYANDWTAITHPSLPNYLAIAGGSTFGVNDDASPSVNSSKVKSARSVFDQAVGTGRTARTYSESMPSSCDLTTASPYAVKHNPWTYFSSYRTNCGKFDVSTGRLLTDAKNNALPNVGMVVPNLNNDGHDGTLGTADNWLKSRLATILASTDFTSGRLVVVVTADEDDRSSGNKVLTVVMHAGTPHKVVSTHLTHYSLTRYYAQVLDVAPLLAGATAPNMQVAFGL